MPAKVAPKTPDAKSGKGRASTTENDTPDGTPEFQGVLSPVLEHVPTPRYKDYGFSGILKLAMSQNPAVYEAALNAKSDAALHAQLDLNNNKTVLLDTTNLDGAPALPHSSSSSSSV